MHTFSSSPPHITRRLWLLQGLEMAERGEVTGGKVLFGWRHCSPHCCLLLDRFSTGAFLLFFVGDILLLGAFTCNRHYHLLKCLFSFGPHIPQSIGPAGSHFPFGSPQGSELRFCQASSLPGLPDLGKLPLWHAVSPQYTSLPLSKESLAASLASALCLLQADHG